MPVWAARSQRGSEPPLTGAELHRLRWGLGGLLALVSAWGVYSLELGGVALLPPLTLVLLAGLGWPRLAERAPDWLWRLVFPGLIAFVVGDLLLQREPLAAMIRLNLLLIGVRAVGKRRPREDLQLVVLCLFLVVVAGVLTVSIGFVLLILVFAALTLTYLLVITLSAASGAEDGAAVAWPQLSWGRLGARLWRVVDWRIVAASAGLYALMVAGASLLFLAMPRFQIENSLGFLQLKHRRSLSGFSDVVQLGEVTDIAQDTTTALRVDFGTALPPAGELYWRMVALDDYHDGGFAASGGLVRHAQRMGNRRELFGERSRREGGLAWTFYSEAGVSRFLPQVGPYARLRLREARRVVVNRRAGTVALQEEPQAMFAFRVEGLELADRLVDPELGLELRRAQPAAEGGRVAFPWTLLEVPAGAVNTDVLDAINREITGGDALPAVEYARRAVAWLARRHSYSMRSAIPAGAGDVLVRWLGSAEPGHCELFAGGFTLLARRAGFPVRVVTGFKGGAWNAFENYFMVRNSDAHAWCELYDGRGNWVRVDPTPGGGGDSQDGARGGAVRGAETDRSWGARLDSLRMLWYRRIVDFDRAGQAELVGEVKEASRRTGLRLVLWVDRQGRTLQKWLKRPWSGRRLLVWGGWLAAAAVAGWAGWRWRNWWWVLRPQRRRGDPVRREAGRWLRRLKEGPRSAELEAVIADLERLRYGPREGTGGEALVVFRRARRARRKCRA